MLFSRQEERQLKEDNLSLYISCPPLMRFNAILIAFAASCILFFAVRRELFYSVEGGPAVWKIFTMFCMEMFFLIILYRNIFSRDEIYILKQGGSAPSESLTVSCSDIVTVRRKSASEFNVSGRAESLGFGVGDIVIETKSKVFPFGRGLSPADADETILKIRNFYEHLPNI